MPPNRPTMLPLLPGPRAQAAPVRSHVRPPVSPSRRYMRLILSQTIITVQGTKDSEVLTKNNFF
jgi:hypothetical protein